jgi:phospholipid/cholesterol/gamma-HCH transport system substrate-binding protein
MKRSLNFAAMNLRVGVIISICLALLIVILFYPIRGISPFSQKFILQGRFNDVAGLKRNAPVFLAGMEVGGVQSVDFQAEGSASRLVVRTKVERRVQHLIRKDSVMRIISQGLLGDKFIEITPGTPGQPQAEEFDFLATDQEKSLTEEFAGVKERIETIMDRTNAILASIQSGQGTLGKLANDPRLYEEMVGALKEIRTASANLTALEKSMRETVMNPGTQQAISSTAASVAQVADKVRGYMDKVDRVRFYMDLGVGKYESNQVNGQASLRIEPNPDRFYSGGIDYFSDLTYTSTTDDRTTYNAALGFRMMESPVFFWGGLKRSNFAAGLDLRAFDNLVGLTADFSRFSRDVADIDLGAHYRIYNVFSLTGGVDDVLANRLTVNGLAAQPRYHAGLTVTYDDEDLTTILIKIKTGL